MRIVVYANTVDEASRQGLRISFLYAAGDSQLPLQPTDVDQFGVNHSRTSPIAMDARLRSHISSHTRTVFHHMQHRHTVSAGVRLPGGELWPVHSCPARNIGVEFPRT